MLKTFSITPPQVCKLLVKFAPGEIYFNFQDKQTRCALPQNIKELGHRRAKFSDKKTDLKKSMRKSGRVGGAADFGTLVPALLVLNLVIGWS